MSVSGIEATQACFTKADVYAAALFRTLIEKRFSREVAGD